MPNAIDYIDWRGDIPFSFAPFNEVDNLLMCKLVSLDFTGIVPSEGERSIQEAAQGYFDKFGEEDVRRGVLLATGAVTMLKRCSRPRDSRSCGCATTSITWTPRRKSSFPP